MSGPGQNDIDVINTATKKLIATIPVAPNPHWVVFGKERTALCHEPHVRRRSRSSTRTPTTSQDDPGRRDPAQP